MHLVHTHRSLVAAATLALLALLAPLGAARAQAASDTVTLTLPEVQRLATQQNPAYLAERQEAAIARGEQRQARLPRFNPDLTVEAPGLSGGAGGEYETALMQEVEWAGQRGLRARAAGIGVTRARATVQNAARLSIADASVAFYRTLAARRRLDLAQRLLALNERLVTAVRVQATEGEISTLEANLAEIESGRARARVLAARRAATSAELELKRLVGLPSGQPVRLGDVDALPRLPAAQALQEDSLVVGALTRRADLASRTAAAREFETRAELARREAIPNVRAGVLARRDDGGSGARVGVGVGIGLPVLNRNQGVVAQMEAQARQATYEARAAELRIRAEVADALRAYRAAAEETTVLESSVLEPAQRNSELLETAFRAGKIALPTLLLLRNQLLDAQEGYWIAWLAQREALVGLEAATQSFALPDPERDDQTHTTTPVRTP